MRTSRRGLTVIELVLILLVLGVVIFFLMRLRGRDGDTAAGAALDSTGALATEPAVSTAAAPGAGSALASQLALSQPLDSTASAGDTLTVRVRATTDGRSGVANAIVHFAADGGGRVQPDSATTNDLGEAEVRWIVVGTAPQVLRATVPGGPAEPLEVRVRIVGGSR